MQITLHKAADDVRALLDQIDPETGEMPEGFDQARAIVATKATAVAAYLIESEKQANAVDEYVKELQGRAKTARKRLEWLREYLRSHMAACGILELKDERGIFKATLHPERDEAIEIFDEAQIPFNYMVEIPATSKPDKALMKRAMHDGFEIPGAKLVKRDRLTIK
jgi:Siphovirus Gp157